MSPKRALSIVEAIEAKQRRIEQQRQRRLNSPVRERHNEQQRQYRMNMSENQRALQRENSRLRMQRIRQGDNLPLPTGTCFEEDQIPLHFCGQLDQVCPKCRAKYFELEQTTYSKTFHKCCSKGKFELEPIQTSELLESLMTGKHQLSKNFMENIRSVNSALAFASMGANLAPPPGYGPYCFRINGQIYHRLGALHPENDDQRVFAQLYILDPYEAARQRMIISKNSGCNPDLMKLLSLYIAGINPFADACKMLHEVEKECMKEATANNIEPSIVSLGIIQDRKNDQRRYNAPRSNEVAIIFQNADGEPPLERDLIIHCRSLPNERLMDYIQSEAAAQGVPLLPGKAVILPSSFQGSPRNMAQNYQDAMAIVRKHGKPDFFVTMTCNPKWLEIVENLEEGQSVENRPDLVVRVFKIKLDVLLEQILKNDFFGKAIASIHVIEFQKRGLPHAHILIILTPEDKPNTVERIDQFISAEITDQETRPRLYEIATRHMVHGPCGEHNLNSPCMVDGHCSKEFPKQFQEETLVNVSGYPRYKWRNNGVEAIQIQHATLIHDEIKSHMESRYVSAPKAGWRLFSFPMHQQSHSIMRFQVHLPGQKSICFNEDNIEEVVQQAGNKDTTLTAWFKLNQVDENARNILYGDIPQHYVFDKRLRKWTPRQRGSDDAKQIREANVIIYDEATMAPKDALRCINNLLKEIMQNEKPLGGKTIVFGGDFRQTLPVVPHGTQAAIVESSIKFHPLWKKFNILKLDNNIRSIDPEFSAWLLKLGNGELTNDLGLDSDTFEIPSEMVCNGDLVKEIYGDKLLPSDFEQYTDKTILCPRNVNVDDINNRVLDILE
ncbi:hypothetical protein LAZ67_2005450, partial [Cordylochernes scorpioides]